MAENPIRYRSRKELIEDLRFARHHRTILGLLFLLLLLAAGLVYFLTRSFLAAILVLLGGYVAINAGWTLIWYRKFGNYKMVLGEAEICRDIIRASLMENFQNVRFDPEGRIPEKVLEAAGFPFTRGYEVYESGNYASAMSLITPLEAEQAAFGNRRRSEPDPGDMRDNGTAWTLEERFSGMIYICHLERPFPPTTICTGRQRKETLSTGDPDFDRAFSVSSQQPGTLPRLLSPAVRKLLTEAAGRLSDGVYIHFGADGNIYLAFSGAVYDSRTRRGEEAFEKLDLQAELVKALAGGFAGGF